MYIKEVATCDYRVETGPLLTYTVYMLCSWDSTWKLFSKGTKLVLKWSGSVSSGRVAERTGRLPQFETFAEARSGGLKLRQRRKRGSIWSRRKWKEEEQRGRERGIHRLSSIVESDAIRNEIGFSVGHSVLLSKYPNRFSRKGVGIRSVAAFSIPSVPFLFVPPCTLARKLQAPRLSCSCTSRTCT